MATWYNGKWPNEVEERARIKAKELVKTYKTVDEINRFLIDNIDDVTYFDEDNETTSAARVLILRSGDSYGFCNAMIMLLEEIGVHGEPIIFKETRKLTGVIANGKIYAPFVQKTLKDVMA